jgi:hypothetical protein
LKYSAWQLSFVLSYKWCYNEKILYPWWYPTMDNSARDFFRSINTNSYIGYSTVIPRTGVFGQGVFANACKRRWWYVETFNNIRNMIFSNYIVTNTGPMELNIRHRHSHFNTTISAMLCYIRWIISRNVSCLLSCEKWG